MGCSSVSTIWDIRELNVPVKTLFKAFFSLKYISYILANNERIMLDNLFLIKTKSIQKYIKCIKSSNSFNYLCGTEKDLDSNNVRESENFEVASSCKDIMKFSESDSAFERDGDSVE